MGDEEEIYVRMLDALVTYAPVSACKNRDDTYHILHTPDFDVEDTATLLEFVPGDDVRVVRRQLSGRGSRLIATELVRSSAEDRDYWRVLFDVATGGSPSCHSSDSLQAIARRVKQESESGTRWHYPCVVEWAKALA
jgi:hypothetical protein